MTDKTLSTVFVKVTETGIEIQKVISGRSPRVPLYAVGGINTRMGVGKEYTVTADPDSGLVESIVTDPSTLKKKSDADQAARLYKQLTTKMRTETLYVVPVGKRAEFHYKKWGDSAARVRKYIDDGEINMISAVPPTEVDDNCPVAKAALAKRKLVYKITMRIPTPVQDLPKKEEDEEEAPKDKGRPWSIVGMLSRDSDGVIVLEFYHFGRAM